LYIPEGNEHHDHSIWVNHNQPHCTSDENYRGIISDRASAVFFGKVLVARDAQKTNANQSNRNLLLSDYGKVNSKPQLEIYADDVICSHGSTTGQLDEEALFFMRSRGISKDSAIRLLLFAFAADVLEDIKNEEFKVYIDKRLHERFDPAK
jgi:Fe-S cluster assembly protein SufD